MTLQTISGGLWIPLAGQSESSNVPVFIDILIDATAEKIAFIFEAPKTGTLSKFEVMLGTIAQAPTNGLRFSFQNVSATSFGPDGTIDQYRVVTTGITTNTWIAPSDLTSDGTDGGTRRSVTRGELVAAVLDFASFSTGDSVAVACASMPSSGVFNAKRPYLYHYTSYGQTPPHIPAIAIKYDDGLYYFFGPRWYPYSGLNTVSLASNTDPKEAGAYFQFPFPCKVGGFWVRGDFDGDCVVVLYDTDGTTELESVSLDKDNRVVTTSHEIFVRFPTDRQLAKDTWYRLAFRPTSTTALSVHNFDVPSAAHMDACELGQKLHWTQKSSADVWSQTATKRPYIGFLVTALDDGAGSGSGGGLLVHPGMNGGCNA